MKIPFVGGAYEGRSKNLNTQECINFFLEPDEYGTPALVGTPGLERAFGSENISLTSFQAEVAGTTAIPITEFILEVWPDVGDFVDITLSSGAVHSTKITSVVTDYTGNGEDAIIINIALPSAIDAGANIEVTPATGVRGAIVANGVIYFVAGKSLYIATDDQITANVSLLTGKYLNSSTGPVIMATNGNDNGLELMIADGINLWRLAIDLGANLEVIEAGGSPIQANSVVFHDGRFLCDDQRNTGRFYYSDIYDGGTWNALSFATAEGSTDGLQGIIVNRRQVYLIGENTVEIWYNSGDTNNPYQRFQGGFIEVGAENIHTVQELDNSIIWLCKDEYGGSQVAMIGDNFLPTYVSTPDISHKFEGYFKESAYAYVYRYEGHQFYVLNFPSNNVTWVYDAATKQWTQWASTINNTFPSRHRGSCHLYYQNDHFIGDYANKVFWRMSSEYLKDGDVNIKRRRTATHITDDENRLPLVEFQVDFEEGTGNSEDIEPHAYLSWSKDGGHNFGASTPRSIANKNSRAVWRKLGVARNWVFKLEVDDPVKWVVKGAFAKKYGDN